MLMYFFCIFSAFLLGRRKKMLHNVKEMKLLARMKHAFWYMHLFQK